MTTRILATAAVAALAVTAGGAQAPASSPAATQAPAPAAQPATQAGRGAPALPDLSCAEFTTALRGVLTNDARMRDFPNLARYREANRTVQRSDVVFMGDSITDNWAQPRFGALVPGKTYIGRGIGGQTTPQMLIRFRPDVINLKPKVVVILAGTNDIAGNTGPMTDEEIEGNLASMAELATAAGIKVILSSITPVSQYHLANPNANPQTTQRPMTRIRAINDWMKSYAAAHKHSYLDYYSAMVDERGLLKTELSADDLHPTLDGYKVMVPLVEAAIARALK